MTENCFANCLCLGRYGSTTGRNIIATNSVFVKTYDSAAAYITLNNSIITNAESIALDGNYAPASKEAVLVDAGENGFISAFFDGKDVYGGQRVYNDVIDIGATLAYGHAGYLVPDYLFDPPKTFGLAFCGPGKWTGSEEGWRLAKRSYFMVQQIAARYTQSDVKAIRYPDADGKLHATSEAMFLKLPARRPTLSATSAGDGKTPLQQKLRVNSGSDKSPIV